MGLCNLQYWIVIFKGLQYPFKKELSAGGTQDYSACSRRDEVKNNFLKF